MRQKSQLQKHPLNVRILSESRKQLQRMADKHHRDLSGEIAFLIEAAWNAMQSNGRRKASSGNAINTEHLELLRKLSIRDEAAAAEAATPATPVHQHTNTTGGT